MPRAIPGVMVECDASIKAIIVKIDSERHDYILEDLDETTVLIKESKLADLKEALERELQDTQTFPEDEDSD
ncbi:transcription factor TFIIH complex subunit Tfb5 [Ascobolus immersus RN42]|uniref:General transcription and DNA repair factor IIH subunit TFB5 n=1 Tax=Ascobolus immersus RN42 TaxID=1160509 RepID=A0A3N4IPU7_ASCIM|nr:transcription factor TFIIH complex subunit Tfb5 [Ascobolus immersus RN42]